MSNVQELFSGAVIAVNGEYVEVKDGDIVLGRARIRPGLPYDVVVDRACRDAEFNVTAALIKAMEIER